MGFRDNLIELREQAGFKTANSLADALNIPRSTYATYESPTKPREPKYSLLCKIADKLCTTPDELLGYRQDEYGRIYKLLRSLGFRVIHENNDLISLSLKDDNEEIIKFYFKSPELLFNIVQKIKKDIIRQIYDERVFGEGVYINTGKVQGKGEVPQKKPRPRKRSK